MLKVSERRLGAMEAVCGLPARPVRWLGLANMTPEEWARVEDNPRQRDTERHAVSAHHLKVYHPTHARVNMAELPNGKRVKLDGHTRSYLWQSGWVEPPPVVVADIYSCPDMDAAKELYIAFDNRAAVETVGDEVFGAVRSMNLVFKSDLLKQFRFVAAIRYAYEMLFTGLAARTISPTELVDFWKVELLLLDEIEPTRKRFPTPIMMGAILTLRKYGARAQPFWRLYASGNGVKLDGRMDAVQALHERLMQRKADQCLSGRENSIDVAANAISAFEKFRDAGDYSATGAGVKRFAGQNLRAWLDAARAPMPTRRL